ncbi:MAG: molybdopterin-dependent oxidoreductase [Hyphomicrobium sp.]
MSTQFQAPVRTTCPYCGVGCGVVAENDGKGGASIAGDAQHPANFGRLCSKGSALGETLGHETRLMHPEIKGIRTSWDEALDHVAGELTRIRAQHGPESIAFYLSGQLLTEDYYVANKFAKGFIGTPHVDTNSRLCMASSVAGHKRAFGADVVPGCYEDLDAADVVVLVGSNTAWCHPILYQRLQKARAERGAKIVNIDPRRTATSEGADLHLSLAPGSDTCLWNGLLVWLSDHDLIDADYVAAHTDGFYDALAEARHRAGTIAKVAFNTGLTEDEVRSFFDLWSASPRVVSCYSQGVNQSVQGTDKVNAIINCHLATGRIAKPGAGPFSLTGQPNAMGGREVGGLANMLAAHMGFSERERDVVGRFWSAPNLVSGEGFKAVQMFEAIERGDIKALWVIGTNPAVSLPRADAVRASLANLEFCAVSEVVASNDTSKHATVRLPAHGWGEKDGTVTNSERRISRQRAFREGPANGRADWWMLSRVAERMGWGNAFAYRSAAGIFREHAALSGFENSGERVFDISGLAQISDEAYDAFIPVQWPVRRDGETTPRIFDDGRFATPTGRARFVAVARSFDTTAPSDAWPLLLNTGRIRDQWHTMTRTGLAPRLSAHIDEPFVEINAIDAGAIGILDRGIAMLETEHGRATLRAIVTDGVQAGTIFAPIHWSDENSSSGRVGALVHSVVDPISGQPDSKATPARLVPVAVASHGFLISTNGAPQLVDPAIVYWSTSRLAKGTLTKFAVERPFAFGRKIADDLLPEGERIVFSDAQDGAHRAAALRDGRVEAIVFLGPTPDIVPSAWLKDMLMRDALSSAERRGLLAGGMAGSGADTGPVVCVCHQVGSKTIAGAIAAGCASPDAIGRACAAGTNCGSCLPELNRMIASATKPIEAVSAQKTGMRMLKIEQLA